jgi:hypothetical protein
MSNNVQITSYYQFSLAGAHAYQCKVCTIQGECGVADNLMLEEILVLAIRPTTYVSSAIYIILCCDINFGFVFPCTSGN